MDNLMKSELFRMKYLFSHERGRVISEQKEGYLLNEAIGELPKDQAEADKFKVWLKQNHPEFRCRVGKSKGMGISTAPNRPYQGPCFKDVWKTYGEAFMGTSTTNQSQSGTTTPISEPDVASDEKNEPVSTSVTATNQGTTNQGTTNQGTTNQGTTNQGTTNQGATNQGATNQEAGTEPEESSTEK